MDLSLSSIRAKYIERIRRKEFFAVISSPPCSTFTRVKMANLLGPSPTRSLGYPRGLPNLPRKQFLENELGNILADFSYEAILTQLTYNPDGCVVQEHPEDLGRVQHGPYEGCSPGSIWQWPEHLQCLALGALSIGLKRLDYGTSFNKPT